MIEDPRHALVFGTLELVSRRGGSYSLHATPDDTDWGNPSPVLTVVESLLGDGAPVSIDRFDNREVPIGVRVKGTDSAALAEAEAALVAETGKRNTLVWSPPDGYGADTVFVVVTSYLEHIFDDQAELRLTRNFVLRLVCEPFTRSVDEVVTAAVTSVYTPVPVTIDACDATPGWTNTKSDTITVVTESVSGGSITVLDIQGSSVLAASGGVTVADMDAIRTGAAVNLSDTPYVSVDVRATSPLGGLVTAQVSMLADGVALRPVASVPAPAGAGFVRHTFYSTDPSVTVFKIAAHIIGPSGAAGALTVLDVDNLTRSASTPIVGTAHQKVRTLPVSGSARTPGSLAIEGSSPLGDVLVYTYPDDGSGYIPPLRSFRVAGSTVTTDLDGTVSGGYSSLAAASVFHIPAAQVPAGRYAIMARLRRPTGTTPEIITWESFTKVGSVAANLPGDTGSLEVPFTTAGEWRDHLIGITTLPAAGLPPESTALVGISVAGANVELDEVWLFNLDVGALTWVDAGEPGVAVDGLDALRVWIDSPTIERPQPAIWKGHNADRSDARSAGASVKSWGNHLFTPASMTVFTVTTEAVDAAVSLRHHPRWFLHAGS